MPMYAMHLAPRSRSGFTCAVVLGAGLLQLAVKVALWDMGSFPDGLDLRRLLGVACLMDHLGMPTTSEGAGAVS